MLRGKLMKSIVLLAAGAVHNPPLIDIDWTVLVQLGLFLLLYLILRSLVFLPYLRMRKEQTARSEGARETATQLDQSYDYRLIQCEARVDEAKRAIAAEIAKERASFAADMQKQLQSARQQADEKLQRARFQLEERAPAAALSLRTRAEQLGREMATRILGREIV